MSLDAKFQARLPLKISTTVHPPSSKTMPGEDEDETITTLEEAVDIIAAQRTDLPDTVVRDITRLLDNFRRDRIIFRRSM